MRLTGSDRASSVPASSSTSSAALGRWPCRELTKRFEETRRGTLGALAAEYAAAPEPRGEVVVLVGPPAAQAASGEALDAALAAALPGCSVRDAAETVAAELGLPRRQVYARALALGRDGR